MVEKQDSSILSKPTNKGATWVKEQYGASSSALRSWANKGLIQYLKTPGGNRLYSVASIEQRLGVRGSQHSNAHEGIIYTRISSSKQRGDLQRKIEELSEAYPGYRVISTSPQGSTSGAAFPSGLCIYPKPVRR